MRRPAAAAAGLAVVLALVACSAESSPRADPKPSTASATPSTASPSPSPRVTPLPDGSRRLFPGHRIVAYYGAAGTSSLGILGSASPDRIWPRLSRQAGAYAGHGARVLPAYELITFVASHGGGEAALRESDATIRRYAQAARRHHALLILDIQPGRGEFLEDAKSLKRWLRLPHVGLALDPEWKLHGDERPLSGIGHTDAATVNRVSAWLDRLTARAQLPEKLLLVHEFTVDMVRDKRDIEARRHVAVVFNVDGFGSRAVKLAKYQAFAQSRRFPLGLKLFYDDDVDLMGPARVMRLHPQPAVVDYQ